MIADNVTATQPLVSALIGGSAISLHLRNFWGFRREQSSRRNGEGAPRNKTFWAAAQGTPPSPLPSRRRPFCHPRATPHHSAQFCSAKLRGTPKITPHSQKLRNPQPLLLIKTISRHSNNKKLCTPELKPVSGHHIHNRAKQPVCLMVYAKATIRIHRCFYLSLLFIIGDFHILLFLD